mgnify:CR=1 FL=1
MKKMQKRTIKYICKLMLKTTVCIIIISILVSSSIKDLIITITFGLLLTILMGVGVYYILEVEGKEQLEDEKKKREEVLKDYSIITDKQEEKL